MNCVTSSIRKADGFSLIELVLVLIILGILAATAVPKFLSNRGFSEFSYRADVIAKLRLMQLKAMQQTDTSLSHCRQILVTATRLGIPDDCDGSPSFTSNWKASETGVVILAQDNVSFATSISNGRFSFDAFGRPVGCGPCNITISGEQTITVRIEKEGYIHAL